MTVNKIQFKNKQDVKQDTPLPLSFLLDANSTKPNTFENLAI